MSSSEIVPMADQMKKAELLAQSTLIGDGFRKNPANVLWAMDMADSLGIKVTEAMKAITVINGKPTMSAELMRGLVLRAGHLFRIVTLTPDEAVVEVARKDWPEDRQTFRFGMDDANRAGLAGSQTYKKHPQSMLLARVTSLACRAVFPDVLSGISYTPEELGEPTPQWTAAPSVERLIPAAGNPQTTVVDTETGEIIEDAEIVDDGQDDDPLEVFTRTESDAITPAQLKKLHATLRDLKIASKDEGMQMINDILGTEGPVDSTKELTKQQASTIIDTLSTLADQQQEIEA